MSSPDTMVGSGDCLLLGDTLPIQTLQKCQGTSQCQVPRKDFPASLALKAFPTQQEIMELSRAKENTHKAWYGRLWAFLLPQWELKGFSSVLRNLKAEGAREVHQLQTDRLCHGNQLVASSKFTPPLAEALRVWKGGRREGTQQFSSVSLNSAAIR